MKSSESIASIAPALIKAQGEMQSVTKQGKNPAFRSRYMTLDSILDAVRPILAKNNLMLTQVAPGGLCHMSGVHLIEVESRIIHASGEWIAHHVAVPVTKHDAHGMGSALTYGRRYGLVGLLAISADDDDDGNTAADQLPKGPNGNIVIDAPCRPRSLTR